MSAIESPKRTALWIGFSALITLFALDFTFDVRDRDLFSWMDPYQYFEFARGVIEGRERWDEFELPSVFPFFVMPFVAIAPTVSAALWVNVVAVLVLLIAIHRLCRALELRTPSPVVALLVLSSPLLIGLSRTLYVEFSLSALMALAFACWLRFLKQMDFASGLAFGASFALAFLTKLTLAVFMILPVAGAILASIANRDFRRTLLILYATTVPIGAAIAIHAVFFTTSLNYYVMVVSTSLPFMHLMGPVDRFSWSSATYYLREIGETFLFLLTPFLLLHFRLAAPRIRTMHFRDLADPRAMLWLWLLSPVLILILHPLKEPRHVAASVVPAVLLVVLGIEGLAKPHARRVALALAVTLACVQYAAVTWGLVSVPYFMDRSLHYAEIRNRLAVVDERALYEATPEPLRSAHWIYNQNIALSGFPPNEALALTWQAFPGVVFDLDTFDLPGGEFEPVPYPTFEDLYFLAAINTYNRRCGWQHYQPTLSRKEVVDNAEVLILNDDEGSGEILERFPDHVQFASIVRGNGAIHLLRATHAAEPYRILYARRFLESATSLDDEEFRSVTTEMLIARVLDGDRVGARALTREFPGLAGAKTPPRNIYWIGGYQPLIRFAAERRSRPLN